MNCVCPIHLRTKSGDTSEMVVACGKCVLCRIEKAAEWATRCIHESSQHDFNVFITLTYNDSNLPEQISKKELQLFFKRLRKAIYPKRIRYLACGEYGEDKYRPHYHAIIFGMSRVHRNLIEKAWRNDKADLKGFVYTGTVTYNSARYVANYVLKGLKYLQPHKQKPFILMSKGLGKSWVDREKSYLIKTPLITIDGVNRRLPRYYAQRLGIDLTQYVSTLSSLIKKRYKTEKVHRDRGCVTDDDIAASIRRSLRQERKNVLARATMYKSTRSV